MVRYGARLQILRRRFLREPWPKKLAMQLRIAERKRCQVGRAEPSPTTSRIDEAQLPTTYPWPTDASIPLSSTATYLAYLVVRSASEANSRHVLANNT